MILKTKKKGDLQLKHQALIFKFFPLFINTGIRTEAIHSEWLENRNLDMQSNHLSKYVFPET